jgi:ATP-binding cassette subfamily F protein 3
VLLVSHDRALLDAVGTRTIAIEDGKLRSYEGGWADYARGRDERRAAAEQEKTAAKRKAPAKPKEPKAPKGASGNGKGTSKNMRRKIGALEREVERAETALKKIEDELADPAAWSTPGRSSDATERHEAAKQAVAAAYSKWEQATASNAS